jgi:hypothetical protein
MIFRKWSSSITIRVMGASWGAAESSATKGQLDPEVVKNDNISLFLSSQA